MDNTFTFDDVLDDWQEHLSRKGKSQHTIAAYRRSVEHFARWCVQVAEVLPAVGKTIPRDVRDWKAHQQQVEKAAPATINQRLAGLAQFFDWARRQNLIDIDPTEDIETLRRPVRQPQSLDPRDLRRLLREASVDVRNYAIIEMLAGTGLRVGELLALQIGDIALNPRSGVVIVRRGKQGNYREVPLTKDVRVALQRYLKEHPAPDDPSAALWMGTRGPLSHRSSVMRLLNKYAQRANIDDVHPHALRHTFATRYLAANPDDLRGLASLLGHADLNTVMIYTEPTLDDLARRMERVDAGEGA